MRRSSRDVGASITNPPSKAVTEGVHDTSHAHHSAARFRRRYLTLVHRDNNSEYTGAHTGDGTSDAQHRKIDRAGIERTTDNKNRTAKLDGSFAAKPVRSPRADTAAYESLNNAQLDWETQANACDA